MKKEVLNKGKAFCWHIWQHEREMLDEWLKNETLYMSVVHEKVCVKCGRWVKKSGVLHT